MTEFFVIDRSTLRAPGEKRDFPTEAERMEQEKGLRDYFTQLAKAEGAEDRITMGNAAVIGASAPMLRIATDDATAKQLQAASKGRLSVARVGKI